MLNELYLLARSLERCGLTPKSQHSDLKPNRNQSGFLLGIRKDGSVASIEFLDKEKMAATWRIESGANGRSFPGFNLPAPIWRPDRAGKEKLRKLADAREEDILDRSRLLGQICASASLSYKESQRKQLESNIRDVPQKIADLFANSVSDYRAFPVLLERVWKSKLSLEDFVSGLTRTALRFCKAGKINSVAMSVLQKLLVGSEGNTRGALSIPILLDVDDRSSFRYVVASEKMKIFVNRILQEKMPGKSLAEGGKGAKLKRGVDPFTGIEANTQTKFPNVRLPIIGPTILMSMTKDSLCQTRYGLQESGTFPAGKPTAQSLQDALLVLTKAERKGKTWRGVPSSKIDRKNKKKQDLLLVYLEDKPQSMADFADLFSEMNDSDAAAKEEAAFEQTAKSVCLALKGEILGNPECLLRVLILSKADEGRKQVVLSKSYDAKGIFRAAQEWQRAATNRPNILLPLPLRKGEKIRFVSPSCPYPAGMMTSLNTEWTQEATRASQVAGCELGQVYDVFLEHRSGLQSTLDRLLPLAVQRTGNLLLGMAHRIHLKDWGGMPLRAFSAVQISVAVVAILLYKKGRRKEVYMKEGPFNVGRLLSLVDQLHHLYCQEVRGGGVPGQLIGNALMSTALQQPISALSLLSQRILPYKAWADTVHEGKKIGLAKYFLKEIGEVCSALTGVSIPAPLTDEDRAEMILGYLASSAKKSPDLTEIEPEKKNRRRK